MSEPKEKKGGNGAKIALIIVIILLIAANGFLIWRHFDTEKKHVAAIEEKNTEITDLKTEATQLLADLKETKAQAVQLGLDTTELSNQILEMQSTIATLKRTKNLGYRKYNAIKGQIAGLKELLLQKDQEIAMKDSTINMQKADIDSLNVQKNTLKTNVTTLTDQRDGLQAKVDVASILRAENVAITMFNAKGKEYEKQPWKAKKIDKLKIKFNLGKNAVAQAGTKPIAIRIIEPGGSALYDLATGGGSFMANGKETFYSAKQEIMFSNKSEEVSFMYAKGSQFQSGVHAIEIYEGENLIGKGAFNVK